MSSGDKENIKSLKMKYKRMYSKFQNYKVQQETSNYIEEDCDILHIEENNNSETLHEDKNLCAKILADLNAKDDLEMYWDDNVVIREGTSFETLDSEEIAHDFYAEESRELDENSDEEVNLY